MLMKNINIQAFLLVIAFLFQTTLIAQDKVETFSEGTSKGYFPVKTSLGLELNYNLEQLDGVDNNFDYGLNFLFTSWYNKNKAPSEVGNMSKNFGLFQVGPSISVSRTNEPETPGMERQNFWTINAGLMYNQMSTKLFGIGFSTRIKGVTFIGETIQGNTFDNVDLKTEVGITFFSVLNVYYGRTFVLKDLTIPREQKDHITVSLVLNPSLLKFGLQGM